MPTTRENASAYRLFSNLDNNLFIIKEYLLTNKPTKEYHATSSRANILEGVYTEFDENGNISVKGAYHKGFKIGEWHYYYFRSNRIREKQIFSIENEYESFQYDSAFQKIQSKGAIDKYGKQNGEWIHYHQNSDIVKLKSNYCIGKKEGLQLEYHLNGKLKRKELFKNNKLLNGELYDENGKRLKYFPAFVYPKYREYVSNYLQKYEPCVAEVLKSNDFQFSVVISKNGDVLDASVQLVDDPICAEKIKATLLKMKKWKPALWENQPIKFTYKSTVKLYVPKD